MYTLMKSEQSGLGSRATEPGAFEQKEVTRFAAFDEAVAACDTANREFKARHYLMNDSGKEYYAGAWID